MSVTDAAANHFPIADAPLTSPNQYIPQIPLTNMDDWQTEYPTPWPRWVVAMILAKFPIEYKVPERKPGSHISRKWKGGNAA